jgi:hypothetical protein
MKSTLNSMCGLVIKSNVCVCVRKELGVHSLLPWGTHVYYTQRWLTRVLGKASGVGGGPDWWAEDRLNVTNVTNSTCLNPPTLI